MIETPFLKEDDVRVSRALFTLPEAASFLGMKYRTLFDWARPPDSEPLITTLAVPGHQPSVPFIGFAEAFVIMAAQTAGISERRIRPSILALRRRYPIPYLLAHRRIYTDGAELLLRVLDDEDLEVPRTNQRQFTAAVKDQLREIQYADDGFAQRIRLPQYRADVTVDPRVASGWPILEAGGARLKDVVDRYRGGDSEAEIARDFGVPLETILEVVGNT
jgi:uncharacterized protein (DUF433 family)